MNDQSEKRTRNKGALFIIDGSITDPILSSQGFPHLARLADGGYPVYVLSIETEYNEFEEQAYDEVMRRYSRTLHFLSVTLLPKWLMKVALQKLVLGPIVTMFCVLRYGCGIIHARSYIPCFVGLPAKWVLGTKLIFDMRGLMIDELISNGKLDERKLWARFLRYWEKRAILSADEIVVVSERFKEHISNLPYTRGRRLKITVIPNCVDFEQYVVRTTLRDEAIAKYLLSQRPVLVYSGSLTSWQSCETIARFFAALRHQVSDAFLLLVTYDDRNELRAWLQKLGVPDRDYAFVRAIPADVPTYLSLGHAGILFRKDELLNRVASPLKFAEYLAAGVPVLLTPGVGDTQDLVAAGQVGLIVGVFSEQELKETAVRVAQFLREDRSAISARCRATAREQFSLPMAIKKYHDIYQNISA